jgi:hypothetical protein
MTDSATPDEIFPDIGTKPTCPHCGSDEVVKDAC